MIQQKYTLETERLFIVPLTHSQLIKYSSLPDSLSVELGLRPVKRIVPESLREGLVNKIIPNVRKNPDNIFFFTIWTIVNKEMNIMVGDLCFKGLPDANGNVEIGYGTYDDFTGKGFMTEAVGAATRWALAQNGVKSVVAETEKANPASHKILMKNGFVQSGEKGEMIWWTCNTIENE